MGAAGARNSTLKAEAEIARRLTPEFAWQTVWLFLGLFAVFALSSGLAVAGRIPLWLAAAINTVFIYALYTVVHEAVHSNISSRTKRLRWVDVLIGVLACVPLWLFFTHHKHSHMVHHARTNQDDDPDIYARGSFLGWCFHRLPRTLLNYFNPVQLYRECRRFGLTPAETRVTLASFAAYAAVALAIIVAGHGYELLLLWFLPWWIGQLVMLTFFTWIPHHDHHETGRYRNTRVSLWLGGNFLLQGQNYHLIHHMIPSVPYYRYEAVFNEMRPILESKGALIEGFWPHPARAA
jgi:beta-carotene hydroxylase